MAAGESSGLADLEKELTCSVSAYRRGCSIAGLRFTACRESLGCFIEEGS